MMCADFPLVERQPRTARVQRAICFTHAFFLFSLIVAGAAASLGDLDSEDILPVACLVFAALALWTFWSWFKLHGTLIEPYGLFLMSSWTFNGGQVFLEVFHLNSNGILDGMFSPFTTLKTEYLVALGICALHLGALWAASAGKSTSRANRWRSAAQQDLAWHTRWVGWLLLLVSIGPAIWVFWDAGQVVVSGGYMSLYQQTLAVGLATGPRVLANFLIPSALLLLAGSKAKRTGVVISALVTVTGSVAMFFLGGRGAAATALVAYVWLYSRTIRPIPAKLLVLPALLLGFVVFPLVRAVRDTRGLDRTSVDSVTSAWSAIDNPVVGSIAEMGQSMNTVAYTLELVPTARPFDGGVSYLYALLTGFPNVAWSVHPTTAHGTLSAWLVYTVMPYAASQGGGLGYSFIAEAYENFGWIGVPLVLLVIGWFAGRLSEAVRGRSDPAILALAATVLLTAILYARSETADLVRNVCWYAILPFLLVRLLSQVRR
ncbi:MAG: O-antigen polysaccharide polymerase Wzy [Bryobacteraceae bacterium]